MFMRRFHLLAALVLLAALTSGCEAEKNTASRPLDTCPQPAWPVAAPTPASPLAGADQIILVVAADWNANQARMQRFERTDRGTWRPVADDVAVTLGKNGLAWGLGLHGAALGPGPVKLEGDSRSPAGVFTFSTAFAYEPEHLWRPAKMPMHRVTDRTVCVESIDSRSYNRILDEDEATPRDYANPDRMLRPDGLYRYGLFVDHNAPDTRPGSGSCIFFHVWRRPGAPTVGCTAMNPTVIQVLLSWMDASRRPILVQLPRTELERLAPAWGAPELKIVPKQDEQ